MVLWKTRGFERNHEFSISVDRTIFDVQELESQVRSWISTMVLWKTRGFERNHEFSISVDRTIFDVQELEFDIEFSPTWNG
jgi:CHASE3 domain sensor protein